MATNTAGPCAGCGKPFDGSRMETSVVVTALGSKWHKACFTCTTCAKQLVGAQYFNVDGKAYCGPCAEKATAEPPPPKTAPVRCMGCKKGIVGAFTKAYGYDWHTACLVCAHCSKPIESDGLYDDDLGKPVHLACLQ